MVVDGVGNSGPSFSDGKERFESESVGEPVTAPSAAALYGTPIAGRGFGCMPCRFARIKNDEVDSHGRRVWC